MMRIMRALKWLFAYLYIAVVFIAAFTPRADAQQDVMVYTKFSPIAPAADIENNPLVNAHYDAKTYEIAYKTFLYSNQVENAFALSYGAVKHLPDSLIWRDRLIQTAIWTNHVEIALTQMDYLIQQKHQLVYLPKAIKLATQMNRWDSLVPLLEFQYERDPTNSKVIVNLAQAYDNIGDPLKAIDFLRQSNKKQPSQIYLQMIASIYAQMGDDQSEYKVLHEQAQQYHLTDKIALKLAEIDYSHAKPMSALKQLQIVPKLAMITNPAFWLTYAEIAWIVGNDTSSRYAYMKLYNLRKLDDSGFQRLLALQPITASFQTLHIALDAWRSYHNPQSFLKALSVSMALPDWTTFAQLYQMHLPQPAYKVITNSPLYWNGQALLLQMSGLQKAARETLLKAVLSHPSNTELKQIYLDFLLTQLSLFVPEQDPRFLFSALAFWQAHASVNDEWANIYTRAFMVLDEPKLALQVYVDEPRDSSHAYAWYNNYAEILTALSANKSAFQVLSANWRRIQEAVWGAERNDANFWVTYNELASHFSPVIISYFLSSYLADSLSSYDSLMTWAISNNAYALSAYLANFFYAHQPPAWAALRLAIMTNDQVAIRKMLDSMKEVLPRKDRVEAALLIDDIPLAQTLAYDGLKHAPFDAERYVYFTEAMLRTANSLSVGYEYEQFGPLQGPREIINARLFLGYPYSIEPYLVVWDPKTNNAGNLAPHSYLEEIVGAALTRKTSRSELTADVSEHKALYHFYSAFLKVSYALTSKLIVGAKLGYNLRSTLNAFMLIAGTQDTAIALGDYNITVRDTIMGSLELDNYHLQDRTTLGNGYIVTGAYSHKFWLSYPDFTLDLSGSIDRFTHTNSLIQGRVLSIFPANIQPTAANLLTTNFWQMSAAFVFGEAFREDYGSPELYTLRENYTHAFRPYASLGYTYTSTSGYGPNIDLGVAGSVLGRDKLTIYYTRSTSTNGQAQSNFMLGARYKIYF